MSNNLIKTNLFSNRVLQIEFKNTKKNNALSLRMLEELYDILSDKKYLEGFSCIIFKGYKKGPFSSGADLADLSLRGGNDKLEAYQNRLKKVLFILPKIKVPKVCIINSFCMGAGFIFALHTDIILATKKSKFSIPASKLGLQLPEYIIKQLFKKFPNRYFLSDILISARSFTAKEAYNANLISQLIEESSYFQNCSSYIQEILKSSISVNKYYLSKKDKQCLI